MEILSFTMTPFAENCYVLKEGDEAMVIDPGESTPQLMRAIAGLRVPMIVLTHSHVDHVGGASAVKKATGAELVCHREAAPMLQAVVAQGRMFGIEIDEVPEPDRFIDEGEVLRVGESELRIVNVPGHAPGHIALIGDGFVIGGDVLFQGSVGRVDLPGGSGKLLLESIRTKLLPLPDETIVYSGHGPATTIGFERETNPYLNYEGILDGA